jgi:uncharacterized heparinase superfamily protein
MLNLKAGYFNLLALRIICLRFFKQLYFSTSFYNNSLKAKTPEQFYFYPNPYLLSSFINQKIFTYRLSKIDPEKFWYDYKDEKEEKDLNSFFWLNLINRKNDGETIQKIIASWVAKNNKFNKKNWQNLIISKRVLAWILNADIILNHADKPFKEKFFNSIISQVNHLKKNINYENDPSKKIELISAIILSGLVFKEYNTNFELGLKLLKNIVEDFFNNDGSPKNRNIYDLVQCSKFLILIKECCKDAQEYIPDYLDDIVEKLVDCVFSLKTPTNKNPLFNGASEFKTDGYIEYLKGLDYHPKQEKNKIADIYVARGKKNLLFFDAGSPPKKIFSNNYQSGPLAFEYFIENKKIITNCGYGNKISSKIELISRLTSAQSTLTLNETSIVKFESNNIISKAFGSAITSSFKVYDNKYEDENNFIKISAKHNGYEKKFNYIHERLIQIDKKNNNLTGEDKLTVNGLPSNQENIYNIRFHLYPGITAVQTMGKNSILIQIEKNKSLIFKANGENLSLEKSIFLGRNQIVNNFCITISGTLAKNENKNIKWELLKNN